MLALLLLAQVTSATPLYLTKTKKTPTDDPAVIMESFRAKQRCPDIDEEMSAYAVTGSFPQLLDSSTAAKRINHTVRAAVGMLVASDVPECSPPVAVTREFRDDGEISCECRVQLRSARLLSVRCESWSAGRDFGAHPQDHLSSFVFDLIDGHVLTSDEILSSGGEEKLRPLLRANLDIAGMVDAAKFSESEIDEMIDQMMKECYVDADGLTCEAPYWPVSYFTSVVSFDELQDIIRPEIVKAVKSR